MYMLYLFMPFLVCDVFYSLSLSRIDHSRIDHAITPKVRKSTPTQNPFRVFESSSFDPPIPSHIRFRDEKAMMNFFKNFQNRGVHLKC